MSRKGVSLRFRVDAFNVFNSVNLANPQTGHLERSQARARNFGQHYRFAPPRVAATDRSSPRG
jgi:hypothetical protein